MRLILPKITTTTALVVILCATTAHAKKEAWYRDQWCSAHHGRTEVTLPDRSRADCITEKHAVEIEFARKWKESIGQSLDYAMQTNKRAGIVLILRNKKDYKYWIMLNSVIEHFSLSIDTWALKSEK